GTWWLPWRGPRRERGWRVGGEGRGPARRWGCRAVVIAYGGLHAIEAGPLPLIHPAAPLPGPRSLAVVRTRILPYPHEQPGPGSTSLCPDRGGSRQARSGLAAHRRRGSQGDRRTDRGRGRAGGPAGRPRWHGTRLRQRQDRRPPVPAALLTCAYR